MTPPSAGLHHVTAISGPARRNADFYLDVLGLRLVKRTVNYDDPGTYHLYYGDAIGSPGSLITFFPWEGGAGGRPATRGVTEVAYAVPEGSLAYWQDRLKEHRIEAAPTEREGAPGLTFSDPDGLRLALVEAAEPGSAWEGGPIPPEHGAGLFHSVTFTVADGGPTRALLEEVLGFRAAGEWLHPGREGARTGAIRLLADPEGRGSSFGSGAVHHVAFRCADSMEQEAIQRTVMERGLNVSPVMDRRYFKSIYFREPGGILLEVATDPPGMAIDEPLDSLGDNLMLPTWLEPQRAAVEGQLPALGR